MHLHHFSIIIFVIFIQYFVLYIILQSIHHQCTRGGEERFGTNLLSSRIGTLVLS